MKKSTFILFSTFIFVLFAGGTVALGSWVSFNGGGNPAPPQIEVLGSDGMQTTVHITVPGMLVEEREVDGQIYQVLSIPDDYATMLNIAKPELPAIRKLVGIPPTCNVSVSIVSQSYTELEGYLVYPFQQPLIEGEEPGPFEIDTVLYGTDSFYPQELAKVGTPAVWRDVRVTVLSLYPVTFNPVTGGLRVYNDLTVQLNYSGTDGVNPLVNPPDLVSPSFDRMYRRSLINYDYLSLDVSPVPLGYLIITPCKYVSVLAVLEPFVEWKRMKGIPVYVEKFSPCIVDDPVPGCIYPDTTWIKETITEYYYQYGIEYVLLVGDEEDIPLYMNYEYPTDYYNPMCSDYWFSLIAEDDDLADVAIGRLSVANGSHLVTMIEKIFAYERWPSSDWNVEKAILVGHQEEYPDRYSYKDCKRYIHNEVMANSGFEVDTLFGVIGVPGVTNQDVINAIQDHGGLSIVNFLGHGSGYFPQVIFELNVWWRWASFEYFTIYNAHSLTNTDHYPVIFNISCFNGMIDSQNGLECLAEAFTRDPDGGACGSLGASRTSFTDANHSFDKALFKAAFDCGDSCIYALGNIINYGKKTMMVQWGDRGLDNARMYLWLGDPEMQIWTKQPEAMEAEYPGYIETGEPIEVTVTVIRDENPLSGALVCLYKPEDVFERGITGTNGQVTLTVNPSSSDSNLYVTVTKHNFHPFEGVIGVVVGVPPETQTRPLTFSLSQNFPNPFNPTTTIRYTIPSTGRLSADGGQPTAVTLRVYNLFGQRVRTLIDTQKQAGSYRVCWDGKDDGGKPVASGVYLYRIKAGEYSQTRKMVILR